MIPEIRDFIGRSHYYQGAVRELAGLLPADDAALDALIGETVAASDAVEFVFIVMAAFCASRPVQARHLARGTVLMPEEWTLGTITSHMVGDIAGPLVEAVTHGRLEANLVSSALFLAARWHQEHCGGKLPSGLLAAARVATRNKSNSIPDRALLHVVAGMSGDAGLMALALESKGLKPGDPKLKGVDESMKALGEQMLKIWRRPPLELLPKEPSRALAKGDTMQRSVARVGRNQPCPCGSGRKYKHCCIENDHERLRHSTDIAGVTAWELRANPERYLTEMKLEEYPAHEVARFDPHKLAPELVVPYLARLCRAKLFDAAVEAMEKLGYSDKLKEPWEAISIRAAQACRKDLVERMLKLRPDATQGTLPGAVGLLLSDEDPARLVQHLSEGALTMLSTENIKEVRGFARTLMNSRLSALGILVARGAIPLLPQPDATELHDHLLETRDKLSLSPDDPVSDILDKRFLDQPDEGKDAAALREAQQRLGAKMQEVQRLKESVASLQKEVARREKLTAAPAPSPVASAPVDESALQDLRHKAAALKAALKARHNERNELRRELQKAQAALETLRQSATLPATPASREEPDTEEDLLLPQESERTQPLRLVEFPRNFRETLASCPRQVARGALAILGRLAAGEPAAFVGAVRLKACPTITRQRIGIDFRLLFRLLPDRVQVVDLIPRQDLERRIKTLV